MIDDFFIIADLEKLENVEGYEELASKFLKFVSIMKTILIVILAAILIYIIYKIIIKLGNRNYGGEGGFTEEREYIKREKKKKVEYLIGKNILVNLRNKLDISIDGI